MQGVTGPQAQGRILEQLGGLAKAVAIEGTKLHPALQQALELLPSRLARLNIEAVMALLDSQGAVGFGDQPVAADQGSRDCANQSRA